MTDSVSLTEEQLAAVARVGDEVHRAASSVERCDRPAAEAAVRAAYRAAGLVEPRLVIWMDSPLGGAVAAVMVWRLLTPSRPSIRFAGRRRHRLLAERLAPVRGRREQLRRRLGRRRTEQLWFEITRQVQLACSRRLGGGNVPWTPWRDRPDALRCRIANQLEDQLGVRFTDRQWRGLDRGPRARRELALPISFNVNGSAEQLAVADLVASFAGLPPALRTVREAVAAISCWWPVSDAVVLTDRPIEVHRDQRHRLHHDTGPAVVYADGHTQHSWHGSGVPGDLIEPGWTAERILGDWHVGRRWCAIERIGGDRFVREAGPAQVGEAVPDPAVPGGTLALFHIPTAAKWHAPVRMLLRTGPPERDGGNRCFAIDVPASLSDPIAAAAWVYGLDPAEYRQLVRVAGPDTHPSPGRPVTRTLGQAITRYGIEVDAQLDRQAVFPCTSGMQVHGHIVVVPWSEPAAPPGSRRSRRRSKYSGPTAVPTDGIAIEEGMTYGPYRLMADGPVSADFPLSFGMIDTLYLVGILTVPAGSTAFLVHPEHGYTGIAAGVYHLRRPREQARGSSE